MNEIKKYIITIIAGIILGSGITAGIYITTNDTAYKQLENQLADSRAEVNKLEKTIRQSESIIEREKSIIARERELADRERENNTRTETIYRELGNIIKASYDDITALEQLTKVVEKLESIISGYNQ